MTATPALIAPVATPIHKTMLLLYTSGTTESIWPTGLLKSCPALFLGAVQLKKLLKCNPRLKPEPVHGHGIRFNT